MKKRFMTSSLKMKTSIRKYYNPQIVFLFDLFYSHKIIDNDQ